MNQHDVQSLHADMTTLAMVTGSPGWEQGDNPLVLLRASKGTARAIGAQQWTEALMVAVILDREVSALPVPVPEADPAGFIWLRWTAGARSLALRIRSSLTEATYAWDRTDFGTRSTWQANSLRDLAEALRGLFGHTEEARAGVVH